MDEFLENLSQIWPTLVAAILMMISAGKVYRTMSESRKELSKAKEDVYQDVARQKKIDRILEHEEDIDRIPEHTEYLKHDYLQIQALSENVKKNSDAIQSLREPILLLLQAELSTMESLKEQGINHTTEKSIVEIKDFLIKQAGKN